LLEELRAPQTRTRDTPSTGKTAARITQTAVRPTPSSWSLISLLGEGLQRHAIRARRLASYEGLSRASFVAGSSTLCACVLRLLKARRHRASAARVEAERAHARRRPNRGGRPSLASGPAIRALASSHSVPPMNIVKVQYRRSYWLQSQDFSCLLQRDGQSQQ